MAIEPWIAVAGDVITLAGGIVLALDAVRKEREFDHHKAVEELRKAMGQLIIQEKGVILTDEDAVTRVFIRQTATQAMWGCWLLVGGFLTLLVAHILEIRK